MLKYKFPILSDVLTVKVGTKYVWEERVRNQATLVHLLEDVYGIKLNLRAFSFYPNYLYFGMPLTFNPEMQKSKALWDKIVRVFESNRWKVYSAYKNVDPQKAVPEKFDTFDDLGFGHVQLLLSELVLMDLNYPSHGVGQQLEMSLFQPLIGFSKNSVTRMVKGRPGSLILHYENDEQLLKFLNEISKRKSYARDPFYIKKANGRFLKSVFKGKVNLNSLYKDRSF
jgi:hypothetical protein